MDRCIECDEDVVEGLAFLRENDPHLHAAMEMVDHVPLRRSTPDFAGLARIVIAQQVSVASARAITARTVATLGEMSARVVAGATDDDLRRCGLSRPKQRTLRTIASALPDAEAFSRLNALSGDELEDRLLQITGVGPWTAQIYRLFCVGEADVLPAGDLALQKAAGWALGLPDKMPADDLIEYGAVWSPWKGVAVRLLWAYYEAKQGGRAGIAI